MAAEKINFQISGKIEVISSLINVAGEFTSRESGALEYMKCVYIEASKKSVAAIGASEHRSIKIESSEIEVKTPGAVLTPSSWISTCLDVIQPGSEVTLTAYDNGKIFVESGETNTSFQSLPINAETPLPDVGDYDPSNFVTLSSEEFVDAFNTVSVAVDTHSIAAPIVQQVYVECLGNIAFLAGMNAKGKYSSQTIKVKESSGENLKFLFSPALTMERSKLFKEGDEITIFLSESKDAHFIVKSKGQEIYHIRLSSGSKSADKYPIMKRAIVTLDMIRNSDIKLEVDKLELLRMIDNARNISSLDPNSSDGQKHQFGMSLDDKDFYVNVHGQASYNDKVPLISSTSLTNRSLEFDFAYGLYGSMLKMVPSNEKIVMRVISKRNADGVEIPSAILICPDEEIDSEPLDLKDVSSFDLGRLPSFMSIFAISNGSFNE